MNVKTVSRIKKKIIPNKKTGRTPKIVLMGAYTMNTPAEEAMFSADLLKIKKLIPDVKLIALSETPTYTAEKHKIESDYSMMYCIYHDSNLLRFIGRSFGIINLPCRIRNLILRLWGKNDKKFFKLPTRLRTFLSGLPLLISAKRCAKGKKPLFLSANQSRLLDNISSGDLVFNSGGGNLNSLSGDLYAYGLNYLVTKIFNKPVILSAQTIGPFNNWFDKVFARYVLNKVDLITLRDKGFSVNVLKELGVNKPLIVEAVDDALFLSPQDSKSISRLLEQERIEISHPLIAINIQDYPGSNKLFQIFAGIADYFIEEMGAKIVFVPMKCLPGDDDRITISEVKKLMKHKDKTITISESYDGPIIKGILGQMDLVISTRYHPIVFASSMLVPSIGIFLNQYYLMKNKGVLDMLGQGDYTCSIEEASFERLRSLIQNALSNSSHIKKEIKRRLEELKRQDLFAVKHMAKMLNTEIQKSYD